MNDKKTPKKNFFCHYMLEKLIEIHKENILFKGIHKVYKSGRSMKYFYIVSNLVFTIFHHDFMNIRQNITKRMTFLKLKKVSIHYMDKWWIQFVKLVKVTFLTKNSKRFDYIANEDIQN